MSIEISVVTKIKFETEHDFTNYLASDQQAIITGFADECRIAWKTKKPYIFKTPRTEIGTVTTSHITVHESKATEHPTTPHI